MRNEDKERLNQQTQKKYLFQRLVKGCKTVWDNIAHKIILIAFYPAAILIWYLFKSGLGLEDIPLVSPVLFVLVDLMLPALLIGGTLIILILFGTPYGFNKTSSEFHQAEFFYPLSLFNMLLGSRINHAFKQKTRLIL